jgi:hypothetical protein
MFQMPYAGILADYPLAQHMLIGYFLKRLR